MSRIAKGVSTIAVQMHEWSEDDRNDAIEFATHPANGVTAVTIFLQSRGIKTSITSVHKWIKSLQAESKKIELMRTLFKDYQGITANEINAYLATVLVETVTKLNEKIEKDGLDNRNIQALTSLAKEARSSAIAMNTPYSNASMKELELGHLLSFTGKLETIFEGDEVILERVKNACKSIMIETEGQYQG